MNLKEELEQYEPFNEQEEKDREVILKWLAMDPDTLYTRANTAAHLTASAWVVNPAKTKVLMAYHNIYNSWAWLGGHADGNEDLLQVAMKEVREESGIREVHPLSEKIFSIEALTVDGHIKKGEYVSSHIHLNITYLLEADPDQPLHHKADENRAAAWFDLEEVYVKSSELWFTEHIYRKLNEKLMKQYGRKI